MVRMAVNILAFNAGWFACTLGGAHDADWVAFAVVATVVMVHLIWQRRAASEVVLLAGVGVLGTIIDSIQMHIGVFMFPGRTESLLVPMWFSAFWVNFATLLNVSLRWMQTRCWAAIVFGLLGGPAAYYAGAKLGAIELHDNTLLALLAIGLEWAVVTPLLLLAARFATSAGKRERAMATADVGNPQPGS